MKKLILSLLVIICTMQTHAQNNVTVTEIPNVIAYEGVAYNASNELMVQQNITLRANILVGSATGSVEWQEVHTTVTNDAGGFTITIGEGNRTGGNALDFGMIDWGSDHYFLKMEMDAAGGTNFGDAATERFCSVPYAFRAAVADSLKGVEVDSLGRVANVACICSLQDAYNAGKSIVINQTALNDNVVISSNTPFFGITGQPLLFVYSSGTNNHGAGEFRVDNGTVANNQSALKANNLRDGNAFTAEVNGPSMINRNAISCTHNAQLGNAFEANLLGVTSQNNTVESYNKGLGSAGVFEVRNTNNNTSSITGQIPNAAAPENSISAHAGLFLTILPTNTVSTFKAQTNGDGEAGEFLINKVTNTKDGLRTQTIGTGNAFHSISSGTAGTSVRVDLTTNANTSDALVVNNSGSGIGGYFQNLYNANTKYSVYSRTVGTGSAGGFEIQNTTNAAIAITGTTNGIGKTVFIDNTNTNNNDNVLEITQAGKGSLIEAYSAAQHTKALAHLNSSNVNSSAGVIFAENMGTGVTIGAINFSTAGNTVSAFSWNPANTGTAVAGINAGNGFGGAFGSQSSIALYVANSATTSSGISTIVAFANGAGTGMDLSTNSGIALVATGSATGLGTAGQFWGDVYVTKDFGVAGLKNSVVKDATNQKRFLSAEESPEVWFTDYGMGQLNNGTTTVSFESEFLNQVNTSVGYLVFVQVEGDCKGIFVDSKNQNSFTVKELQQGTSSVSFSYRIVAKRKGYESLRMANEQQRNAASTSYLQTYWPEVIQASTDKFDSRQQQYNINLPQLQNPSSITPTAVTPPTVAKPNATFTNTTNNVPALIETPIQIVPDN